jgi:Zn-dependent protease
MSYNPFYEPDLHRSGRAKVRFSRTEALHLTVAVVLLTLAFTAVLDHRAGAGVFLPPDTVNLLAAFLAVSSGFVLHELAHKVLAQRYGHWAEFRAQFPGLGLTLLVAVLTKFLFAAPGAVLIQGRVTPRENGLISLVGPGTNFLIALVTYPLAWTTNVEAAVPRIFGGIAFVNAILCLFNLIPVGPLDGRKVLHWNKLAYGLAVAAALGLYITILVWENGPPL